METFADNNSIKDNNKLPVKTKNLQLSYNNDDYLAFQATEKFRKILPSLDVAHERTLNFPSSKKSCRTYSCCECEEKYSSYIQLKLHEDTHKSVSSGIYICDYCFSLQVSEDDLTSHIISSHSDKQYKCYACDKPYKGKGYLKSHNSKVHHREKLLFYCSICGPPYREFDSRSAIESHYKEVHNVGTPHKLDVENESDDLNTHAEFLDEFLIACNEDSLQLPDEWEKLNLELDKILDDDATKTSNIEKRSVQYYCPKCSATFKFQRFLQHHLAEQHGFKILTCNGCESSFDSKQKLKNHKKSCNILAYAKQNLKCTVCQKTMKSNKALSYHMKTHKETSTDQLIQCPFCAKSFPAGHNLIQHIRIVHRIVKPQTCQLCDKQFATVDHLRKHVLSQHEKERHHSCSTCQKSFTQKGHLKQHMLIHIQSKPFQCILCDQKFWKKIDLERHVEKKHSYAF